MIYLVLLNLLLAVFDGWLTARRINDYGVTVELNGAVRKLSSLLGPELGSVIGVVLPATLWTYLLFFFNHPLLLGLLTGFNLKRAEIQIASLFFERQAKNIKKMINDYHKIAGGEATLPSDSNESKPPACSSDSSKCYKYSERYEPSDK